VDYFNRANGTSLEPIGETYLILEWMRNQEDRALDDEEGATAPTLPPSTDNTAALFIPEAQDMFMAMFSGLVPNRINFARVKTILTVSRDGDGIRREYSYTIQLANNRDFLDSLEVTTPVLANLSEFDPMLVRRSESEWSRTIHIFTGRSDSEYDGMASPDMFPLPDRDYEIIYDDATRTLTFRFRTNQRDQDGNHDNQVDQRFISRLIEKKTYVYNVDMTRFFYLPVNQRILDLPYSIFTAFEERQIALRVTADNVSVTFPPGYLPSDIDGFGVDARIRISLSENDEETPELNPFDVYASRPQRLDIRIRTPIRETIINPTIRPLNVEMRLLHPIFDYPSHVGAYVAHMDTIGWEQRASKPNMNQDSLTFETYDTALYSAISSGTPSVAHLHGSSTDQAVIDAIQLVNSKIRITDIDVLLPNSAVSAGQMNQLVNAIANDSLNVELNAPLNHEDLVGLIAAGLITEKTPVLRQDAIAVLVRLYELRTGRPVIVHKNVLQTPFTDIVQAPEEYHEPLLKAAHLGMLSAANEWNRHRANDSPLFFSYRANPSGFLTTGDLFKILEIVLRDSHGRVLEEQRP